MKGASQGDRIDLAAVAVVPSGNDQSGTAAQSAPALPERLLHLRKLVLVGVAKFLEQRCCRLCSRGLVVGGAVHAQVVLDNVGHRLCVGCRTGSAAPDGVVDLCEFVRDSVCDVCSGRRPTVGG